ncbi:hypothetical protein RFI_25106, partial [Reticulomyxa filosa]
MYTFVANRNLVTPSVNHSNVNYLSPGLSLFSTSSIPNSPNVQPLLATESGYFISHPNYNAAAMAMTASNATATTTTTPTTATTSTTPLSTSASANGMMSNPLSSLYVPSHLPNLNLLATNQIQSLSNIHSGTPKSIISSNTTASQSLTDYSNTNSDAK